MGTTAVHNETRWRGLPVSDGVAMAPVCLFNDGRHGTLPINHLSDRDPQTEQQRLEGAIRRASRRLDEVIADVQARIGEPESAIFRAQKAILHDPALGRELHAAIHEQRLTAETAVSRVLDRFESRLLEIDEAYIKERATDVGEVRRRLLDMLGELSPSLRCDGHEKCQRGRDRIVVAAELTPSLTVDLDTARVRGLVTERGGANSHAAILARALGIPAVSGIPGIQQQLACDTPVLIDGREGLVIAWPGEQTLERYRPRLITPAAQPAAPVAGLRTMANINVTADVAAAVAVGAEGIGLYRTEFEFLAAERLLDEQEQYIRYRTVLGAMEDQPVYFRLLDIGGDKGAAYFDLPSESNPYLGLRGSRLLLARPDLLTPQARALARASRHGPVWVMYPMIVSVEQYRLMRQRFNEAVADLPAGELHHGPMFEVPAACLQARQLLEQADFGSIGSNDLVQYLFAVDRNNASVAADYAPDQPPFWAMLKLVADAAGHTGRPLSICGEVAAAPEYLPRLMDLGIRTVSVSPRLIPLLRRAVLQRRGG